MSASPAATRHSLSDEPAFQALSKTVTPHFVTVWVEQAKLNDDWYFKRYWVMQNAAELKHLRAGMFDLEWQENRWTERREFLLDGKASATPGRLTKPALAQLARMTPGDLPYVQFRSVLGQTDVASALVGESLQRLFPSGDVLAQALQTTVAQTVAANQSPPAALAMEVATSILYLDASLEDGELDQAELGGRIQRLAGRIDSVREGADPQPLDVWMEELYRRVSDRQTMGSVVQELRASLSEIEKQIDQYFRDPTQRQLLIPVPAQLSSMRGVLSVLGLDHAERTVVAMRQIVETKLVAEHREEPQAMQPVFDLLANNLGAMGFMLDMLNHQPKLAKKLFVFHDSTGEFKPVMGRHDELVSTFGASGFSGFSDSSVSTFGATTIIGAERDAPAPPAPVPAPAVDDSDTELLDIFLEEAQEVIGNGRSAIAALFDAPSDMAQQTTLRRAFHTLKGSSRMVGLSDFGESAWALEQVLNGWLAENRPASPELLNFCTVALDAFAGWRDQIAEKTPTTWVPKVFQQAAQAFGDSPREHNHITIEIRRVGENKPIRVDVRIIAATNQELLSAVAEKRFRQDLYYRLNVARFVLPPLRDRREDIPLLARHFLTQHTQRYRKGVTGFDAAALQVLVDHRWPGNVRELDHAIERAVLMTQGPVIRASDLGLRVEGASAGRLEDMSLEDVEAFLIKKAMAKYGNVSHAARALGLSRSALYRRLERYKL